MMYTVKRIDEDQNFGCEERPGGRHRFASMKLIICPERII